MSLQAEIMDLRSQFLLQAKQDDLEHTNFDPEKTYSLSFAAIRDSKDGEQLNLLNTIRRMLKEYCKLGIICHLTIRSRVKFVSQ